MPDTGEKSAKYCLVFNVYRGGNQLVSSSLEKGLTAILQILVGILLLLPTQGWFLFINSILRQSKTAVVCNHLVLTKFEQRTTRYYVFLLHWYPDSIRLLTSRPPPPPAPGRFFTLHLMIFFTTALLGKMKVINNFMYLIMFWTILVFLWKVSS